MFTQSLLTVAAHIHCSHSMLKACGTLVLDGSSVALAWRFQIAIRWFGSTRKAAVRPTARVLGSCISGALFL